MVTFRATAAGRQWIATTAATYNVTRTEVIRAALLVASEHPELLRKALLR